MSACEDITGNDCRGFFSLCIARENIICDVDENLWPDQQERQSTKKIKLVMLRTMRRFFTDLFHCYRIVFCDFVANVLFTVHVTHYAQMHLLYNYKCPCPFSVYCSIVQRRLFPVNIYLLLKSESKMHNTH